jgi:hypothetical protein
MRKNKPSNYPPLPWWEGIKGRGKSLLMNYPLSFPPPPSPSPIEGEGIFWMSILPTGDV